MKEKPEYRVCKNKDCQKPLPANYKYKYCEACRNQHAHAVKNVLKGVGVVVGTAATIIVAVATKGKINLNIKK